MIFFVQTNQKNIKNCVLQYQFISVDSEKNVVSYLISSCKINKAKKATRRDLSLFYLLKK